MDQESPQSKPREFSVSAQELSPGLWAMRFHPHPDGRYLDDYVGGCVAVARGPIIVEILMYVVDGTKLPEDVRVQEMAAVNAAGDRALIRLGFRYRFQERVRNGGLKGYLIKLEA